MLSKKFPFPIVKDGLLLVCLVNYLCCYKRSYFDNLSARDLAKELQVSQVLINKRKTLILKKLKKLLES